MKSKEENKMKNVLVIKQNLLPWYDAEADVLETDQQGFPSDTLAQIVAFGDCKLELIDEEEAHFIRLGK
jgi:hypothetical protein